MKSINNNYKNNKIGLFEYYVLIVLTSKQFFNGITFQKVLGISNQDIWISLILGFIFGVPFVLLLCYLNKLQINLLNTKLKHILVLLISISFMILLNDCINFVSLKYLFETKNLVIMLLFIISCLIIANKNIEAIGRCATIMFYFSVLLFIINTIAVAKYIELDNIKPIFTNGNNILKGALYFMIYTIPSLVFLNIIPKNNTPRNQNKVLIAGYITSYIAMLIITISVISIYNYTYLELFNYPIYFVLKKINYEFVSNAENILALYFITEYIFSLVIYLYIIKNYIFKFKKKKKNTLYFLSIAILSLISVYLIRNIEIINLFYYDLLTYVLIAIIIVFSLYTILKIIKKNTNT